MPPPERKALARPWRAPLRSPDAPARLTTTFWLSWQGYLLGPLGGRDGAWAGANLGVLVSLLVGVLGHLALGRGRVARQEARS